MRFVWLAVAAVVLLIVFKDELVDGLDRSSASYNADMVNRATNDVVTAHNKLGISAPLPLAASPAVVPVATQAVPVLPVTAPPAPVVVAPVAPAPVKIHVFGLESKGDSSVPAGAMSLPSGNHYSKLSNGTCDIHVAGGVNPATVLTTADTDVIKANCKPKVRPGTPS